MGRYKLLIPFIVYGAVLGIIIAVPLAIGLKQPAWLFLLFALALFL